MSLSRANIDLISEKGELDAFLSKCLEMQAREDAPKLSPQPQEDVMKYSGVIEGAAEPVVNTEPVEIAGPVAEEVPSVQAEDGKPAESLTEKAAPVESTPAVEFFQYPEVKPDIHTEEISRPEKEAKPLQPEVEVLHKHFGLEDEVENKLKIPADEVVAETPQAVAPVTNPDTKPDLSQARLDPKTELPAELRSPYLEGKSPLRKPSKNAGAMAYAQESEKKKKRLFVAVGIFVAFLIGVALYFYMFPNVGNRPAEIISGKPNVTTSSQEQGPKAADSKADSNPEEGKQIHKKITRGGT